VAQQPTVLIMAAGQGTRMRSSLPKVLHPVCGRPMIGWVIAAARGAGADPVLCVTRPGDGVAERLPDGSEGVEQLEGEGTGAAVLAAAGRIDPEATLVILSGDHPLISTELVSGLIETHEREGAAATLLTTEELDPAGYGRIVRGADGSVGRIVETKHPDGVSPEELAIREINIGAYAFAAGDLFEALKEVDEVNGERYLTGVFPVLRERGLTIAAHRTDDTRSAMGVNTRVDLMRVEETARRDLIEGHALAGVTFAAPETVTIDAGVEIGEDTLVHAGVTLNGDTRVDQRLAPRRSRLGRALLPGQLRRARRRQRRPVRLPAARRADRRGREDRHVRRGQERERRGGSEDPPPLVHRRCRRRRSRQCRGWKHHRELRRAQQAPHGDRRGREDGGRHGIRRTRSRRGQGVHWRWVGHHRRRTRRGARNRPPAPEQRRGIRRENG
jgi:NDP-sugar pyrophosphorylase family protein